MHHCDERPVRLDVRVVLQILMERGAVTRRLMSHEEGQRSVRLDHFPQGNTGHALGAPLPQLLGPGTAKSACRARPFCFQQFL